MDFLVMIMVGIIGLGAFGRLFGLLFKLMGRGFDALEDATIGNGRRRRSRYDDDDD